MDCTKLTSHPSHLWIGRESTLINKAEQVLQEILCPSQSCGTCTACKQIVERQHSALLWLSPEKNYTLEVIEPIFKTASFALQPNEQFFFVLEKADFFNQACANALLKILEEPPTGYHFILLAQRFEYILPTIRSRCLLTKFQSLEHEPDAHQIITWFKQGSFPDPTTFAQHIDKANISDRESIELLDELLAYWSQEYALALQSNDEKKSKHAQKMVHICTEMIEKSPMPGSSKIFWKDFYLQLF